MGKMCNKRRWQILCVSLGPIAPWLGLFVYTFLFCLFFVFFLFVSRGVCLFVVFLFVLQHTSACKFPATMQCNAIQWMQHCAWAGGCLYRYNSLLIICRECTHSASAFIKLMRSMHDPFSSYALHIQRHKQVHTHHAVALHIIYVCVVCVEVEVER